MPQAVEAYLESNNLKEVDRVKRGILRLYLDDFQKIDPTGNVEKLFRDIPAQLSSNVSRYRPYSIIGGKSEERRVELLQALSDSKTTLFCYRCNDPSVGMSMNRDLSRFKVYLADTGLFVTLCFWDKNRADNELYDQLLSDRLSANLGYVYENVVAQMLAAAGHELYYYTFAKDEKHNYEVDFVLSKGNKIVPVEVKSSGYARHASIDAFRSKYSSHISRSVIIYPKDLQERDAMLYLPVYMTPLL